MILHYVVVELFQSKDSLTEQQATCRATLASLEITTCDWLRF